MTPADVAALEKRVVNTVLGILRAELDSERRRTLSEVQAETRPLFDSLKRHVDGALKPHTEQMIALQASIATLAERDKSDRDLAERMLEALQKRNALDEAAAELKKQAEIDAVKDGAAADRRLKFWAIVGTVIATVAGAAIAAIASHFRKP